jgi:hypothetical protein
MSWTGSTRGEPGSGSAVHRGPTAARTKGAEARRRAHRSMASGHFGAQRLIGGGAIERGEHGELGSALTGARAAVWRPSDSGGNGGGGRAQRQRCSCYGRGERVQWGGAVRDGGLVALL